MERILLKIDTNGGIYTLNPEILIGNLRARGDGSYNVQFIQAASNFNDFKNFLKSKNAGISDESIIIIYNFKDAIIKGSSVTVSEKVASV